MQYHWLNKADNDKLIVFFAGWSFDYKPFEFLNCEDSDVLMIYDYNIISDIDEILQSVILSDSEESHKIRPQNDNFYKHKYLITWSMGVFVAYLLRNSLPEFDKKIAINGTIFPVDDNFGIPQKPFLLTLKHARIGLEGKFYKNIFNKNEEYERYTKSPVSRSIENRINELNELYKLIKENSNKNLDILNQVQNDNLFEKYYDKAIVSLSDKIIPPKNQINFWQTFETPFETIESGHFPYYNFKSWKELL